MSEIRDKILATSLERRPFPHFITDDLFDDGICDAVNENWPDYSLFDEARPEGNYEKPFYLHLGAPQHLQALPPKQRKFWDDFIRGPYAEIVAATFTVYAAYYHQRFGALLDQYDLGTMMLMESQNQALAHRSHTHHFHDPTWLFTNLIYVDDGGREDRGTVLYSPPGDPEGFARKAANWNPWVEDALPPAKVNQFKPNRMLSMIDSPISIHGVEPGVKGAPDQRRRIIRAHLRAPTELTQALYGVSYDEFHRAMQEENGQPKTVGWMQRDIDIASGDVQSTMSPSELAAMDQIQFVPPPPLDT